MAAILFETPRLRARPMTTPDLLQDLLAVYGDREVVRHVADGVPLDCERCRQWLEVTAHNFALRGYGMVCLVERDSGAVAGFAGLVHPGGQPQPELKYALRRDRWGRGLATEAARALLRWAAAEHGVVQAIATTAPENAASHAVLLKAGLLRGALRRNDDGSLTQLFEWRAAPPRLAPVLVSACLLGQAVRHDGRDKRCESALLQRWRDEGRVVALCPELAGGLPVPRPPAEIEAGAGGHAVLDGRARVLDRHGRDASTEFVSGAREAAIRAAARGIRVAVLKENSPSCGSAFSHDGSFAGRRVAQPGVAAAALQRLGVQVFGEDRLTEADAQLRALDGAA